ncbi:MAG: hypothetical protein JHC88_18290 [Niveispirillum sp.]|nr:hypothetical protein [Niveispirillum sp.]
MTARTGQPGNAEFRDAAGLFEPDLMKDLYLISGGAGAVEVRLPNPSATQAVGRRITIKKSDTSDAMVSVTAATGIGPDGRVWKLARQFEQVTVFSNGAAWWVTSASRMPATVHFHEAAGLFQPDLGAEHYLVSAHAGVVEVRLPAPAAANSGTRLTVKKTDPSTNIVNVTSGDGSGGPDGGPKTLTAQYDGMTLLSNGAAWHILGRT